MPLTRSTRTSRAAQPQKLLNFSARPSQTRTYGPGRLKLDARHVQNGYQPPVSALSNISVLMLYLQSSLRFFFFDFLGFVSRVGRKAGWERCKK